MAVNKCDELFGKSGELVEFRKKQVLEGALEIVQRNYKETPNKMEVIAALFGKKLNEAFYVKGKYRDRDTVRFTKSGVERQDAMWFGDWALDDEILRRILTGKAVIVDE